MVVIYSQSTLYVYIHKQLFLAYFGRFDLIRGFMAESTLLISSGLLTYLSYTFTSTGLVRKWLNSSLCKCFHQKANVNIYV